jgi:hypothetical protein
VTPLIVQRRVGAKAALLKEGLSYYHPLVAIADNTLKWKDIYIA